MNDPQVRAVIKENLFKGMLVRPIVVTFMVILFWYQLVRWPEPMGVVVGLAAWWFNSLWYFILYFYHRFQPVQVRQRPEQSIWYLRLLVLNCWLDSAVLGMLAPVLLHLKPEWELMVVVGLIMYMFSAFIKNMSYAAAARYLPALVFTPTAVVFFMSGDGTHITIGLYFLISMVSVAMYGANMANIIQLPIYQRFQLEALTQEVKLAKDRADAANAAKSHFFTAASHDARQPLQVISLLFQTLLKSDHLNGQDKQNINKIAINLGTIRNLFDRVLDISRVDAGQVKPVMTPVCLQSLFDKLDAQFGEVAASKGLWLRFVPTNAWVEQDEELLERMVSNLVHNAIKYTPEGGVWVAWRVARGRLEVRDSGMGISQGDQQSIFDEFVQLKNPARKSEGGLGLGLSIVKRLAALTGTGIGLRSDIGRGSLFWLGLHGVSAPAARLGLGLGQQVLEELSAGTQLERVSTRALEGVALLFVEDEPQLRELITQLLQKAGATVYAAAGLTAALALVQRAETIDLVLSDYRLGIEGNGIDVVKLVRQTVALRSSQVIPAILLTGDTAVKDLQEMGDIDHLTLLHKPIDFEDLLKVIGKLLQHRA